MRFSNAKGKYIDIGYSVPQQQLFIDRTQASKTNFETRFAGKHSAPLPLENNKLKLHIFLDVASVEMFANDGQLVMTDIFFPTEDFSRILVLSKGSTMMQESKIYTLKSIWR